MTSQSVDTNLSIKAAVTIGTMINFDSELDGYFTCKQTFKEKIENTDIDASVNKFTLCYLILFMLLFESCYQVLLMLLFECY